jgi:hypothetical protein
VAMAGAGPRPCRPGALQPGGLPGFSSPVGTITSRAEPVDGFQVAIGCRGCRPGTGGDGGPLRPAPKKPARGRPSARPMALHAGCAEEVPLCNGPWLTGCGWEAGAL